MKTKIWGDTSLKGIQRTYTTSVHQIVEQTYPVSATYAYAVNVPVAVSSKNSILKFLYLNRVYDINDTSLFIDTRKQEVFDWSKNTNAYQRIIHLSDLENNWDGYNAPKFSKEQIDLALTFYSSFRTYCINTGLDCSKVEPFVAPSSDGTILFEWGGKRFPSRQLEIYISVSAEGIFEYLKTDEGSCEDEGEFHLEQLCSILDWLFKFDR